MIRDDDLTRVIQAINDQALQAARTLTAFGHRAAIAGQKFAAAFAQAQRRQRPPRPRAKGRQPLKRRRTR